SGSLGADARGELIYGRLPVYEAMRAKRRTFFTLYTAGGQETPEMASVLAEARDRGITETRVDRRELDRLTDHGHHQGLAADVSAYPYEDFKAALDAPLEGEPFWLVADHIADPQNLGSLLRSADAAGVTGVVIPSDRAAGVTPAAVRASAGAAEHVKVYQVVNIVRSMVALRDYAFTRLVGLESVAEAVPWYTEDMRGSLALVVGSEGKGLGRLVRETCDALIQFPMVGKVTSMNAGVCGALAMFEVVRQRG
ncbi:MAG: 23S rRNA (guanosine(2251)-2'-O)-methyltransferase RlmB, partial [Verrucomicrobia bacterium]|nr:23S rRNA (guanosine(2251)-2'-O)-methyltransferase RlmB [Verrucomicrobiota bacterium]